MTHSSFHNWSLGTFIHSFIHSVSISEGGVNALRNSPVYRKATIWKCEQSFALTEFQNCLWQKAREPRQEPSQTQREHANYTPKKSPLPGASCEATVLKVLR